MIKLTLKYSLISATILLMAFAPVDTPTEIVKKAYYNVRSEAYSMNMTK